MKMRIPFNRPPAMEKAGAYIGEALGGAHADGGGVFFQKMQYLDAAAYGGISCAAHDIGFPRA
jgi:hypothetical protein